MKKFLYLTSLFVFTTVAIYSAVARISEFGGLNTDDNALFLKDQTPDAENIVTDDGSGLKPRAGYIQFSTESSKNLFSFYIANGSKYFITQSSNVLKATLGSESFTITISTVDPDVTTYVTGLGDELYFCNTTDGLKYWDTSDVYVVGTYKPKFLVTHKGRLWMAGISGDERTIYVSEYLDGSNFTLAADSIDTDPSRLQIQGALDDILTGLYATYDDKLMWYKQRSFGAIFGSRKSNFKSREYSDTVGCNYPDSIKNCDGMLRWFGNDRIIYEFDGEKYYPISQNIDTYMETIEQGDLNNRQWVQTSAADWASGTLGVAIDTTTSPGDIGLFSGSTTQVSVFLATGATRSGGTSDSMYSTYDSSSTGAYAVMFIATDTFQLDKVTMGFQYKSNVVEGYDSWLTLHTGATCPAEVVFDTSTTKISSNTNSNGNLTTYTSDYYFSQSTMTDKRLAAGNTYWFVMHTTITNVASITTQNFDYSGSSEPFVVPIGVSSITIELAGGSGGVGSYALRTGSGALVTATMTVTPGDILSVFVGGAGEVGQSVSDHLAPGGWNGGGDSTSVGYVGVGGSNSGGGGSSDIRINGSTWTDRILVAAGGGGYGNACWPPSSDLRFLSTGGAAGFGTPPNGEKGGFASNYPDGGGGGGTQSSGGVGGQSAGKSGILGVGGESPSQGGGGGGYYGGGGGGCCNTTGQGGGGGGSSYFAHGGATFATGYYGNGGTTITYIPHAEFYAPELATVDYSSSVLLYTSSFTTGGSNYTLGSYDGTFQVYFATMVFYSTFTTRSFDANTKFNEWGTIGLDDTLSGGSIDYTLFVDTDSSIDIYDSSTYLASQSVVDGQTPSIEVGQYITVSADFYKGSVSTHSVILHSITVNFSEGSAIRTFADYIENRYWLAVAVFSTSNNKVLVYDKNRQWQRYSGIHVDGIVNYSGTFYFGDSNGIYQLEYGTDDDGSAIDAYYKTKTFPVSGADTYTTFDELFMTTINSDATLETEYYVNEDGNAISMADYAMDTKTGYQNFKLPFSVSKLKQGKYISFKWSISSINAWRLLNGNLYYTSDPAPQE